MASAMRVFRKFRSSDGRIKIATLSGVSALVAVIALLVGVLPVFASHTSSAVPPVPLDEGGGSGKCFVETGGLPSVAGNEFHVNNPTLGEHTSTDEVVTVTVYATAEGETPAGTLFEFNVDSGFVVYDVVVNGGPKSLHYDYDANVGAVSSDVDLHAPEKNRHSLHNLSHINICYDVPGLTSFVCDADPVTLTEEQGFLTIAAASIFANSEVDCTDKAGSFLINADDSATLDFGTEDGGVVAGRLDITKDFTQDGSSPADPTDFENLEYDGPGDFVDLQWCEIRTPKATGDGIEFDDVLAADEYPSLDGVTDTLSDNSTAQATACKVAEEENAAGIQFTVVYFEFVDPNFR